MTNYDRFLSALQHLKVDRSGGVAKPYKPLMLCAVVVLIHKGEIQSREVFLDGGLESVFYQLLHALFGDRFPAAKAIYPFRHLENDGIWRLVAKDGEDERLQLARRMGGPAWQILKHVACAQLDPEVFLALATDARKRLQVLETLVRVYRFPPERVRFLWALVQEDKELATGGVRESDATALTEKAVEEWLQRNWGSTEFSRLGIDLCEPSTHGFRCRQVLTPMNTIDLLGFHQQRREWWVFELKKGRTSDAVVGQIGRYIGWMRERVTPTEDVRGAIIVGRTDDKLIYSVRSNARLSLWEYDSQFAVRQVAHG